jgi:HEPN domain-containing protein
MPELELGEGFSGAPAAAKAAVGHSNIPSRYPDALPEGAPFERYRRSEAERLLAHAEAVYAFCESLLSQMD